jgi:hypothetical protein
MMEEVKSYETSVSVKRTISHHIPAVFFLDAAVKNLNSHYVISLHIVTWLTINGVWIGNQICCTFVLVTTNNYDSLTELHILKITVTTAHMKYFTVFTSRCLVAASNGGRFPFSGFPNCPRPHLPASHFSQLQYLTDSTHNWTTSPRHIAPGRFGGTHCLLLIGNDAGSRFLQNLSKHLPDYTVPLPLLWEPEIRHQQLQFKTRTFASMKWPEETCM